MISSLRQLFLTILAATLLSSPAFTASVGYYSDPDIHDDTVIFTSEGDLWKVSVEGGAATRITNDPGIELQPRISPDGKTVAFAAQYDGNLDVYTMPLDGGAPKRLTWHPYSDLPSDWTPDGESILYFTARDHPHHARETWIVPASGGVPSKFPIGTACYATVAPDGKTVAFNRNYVQRRTWKRYGGGLADDIWVGDLEKGEFDRLTEYFGNDLSPMFANGLLYFLSERDGRMNLWSMTYDGKDLAQRTHFEDFDIQQPGTDGDRIVFQKGADLYLYDPANDGVRKIDIQLPTDRARTRPQLPSAAKFTDDFSLSNDGRKTIITARGDLFNVPVESGRVAPLTDTRGIRETVGTFAGKDDEFVVYLSDEGGDYELYRADARTGRDAERLTDPNDDQRGYIQPFFALEVSPDGSKIAFADQRSTLYWIGTTTPTLTLVDSGGEWETRGYEWSPDGRYLAYEKHLPNEFIQLYIYDSVTGENTAITDDLYYSYSPTWDPEGEYLFFLSDRTYNRERGVFEYEVVMTEPTLIYAIPLNAKVNNPFRKSDPYEEDDEKDAKKEQEKEESKKDDTKSSETLVVEIDFDHIMDRTIVFPMESGDYDSMTAAKGRVYYVSRGDTRDLMIYDYTEDEPEAKTFKQDIQGYTLSRNREHIAYRAGDKISVTKTTADKADGDDKKPILDRVNLVVDPPAEWNQMFDEVYRYYRDYFYDPNMAGNDWSAIADRYRPLVERVAIRQELTNLIGNMIAELGHGHTYIIGDGDAPKGRSIRTGLPGADLVLDEESGRVRLAKIYRGERWNPDLESPFSDRRLDDVEDGWYLLEVNGAPVTPDVDPLSHFWGLDGQDVLLRLSPTPSDADAKDYRVTLLRDDNDLRYEDWILSKRQYVTEKSDGSLGYMYLPNMSDKGLKSFFAQFYGQIRKEGMVIDIRWNGGGNVSQLLIRRLNQKLYAMSKARNFDNLNTYPSQVFLGPMATLINERCGSDGDIFARSFEHFEMGPLIGTKTWGGTVGIRSHTGLIDGGRVTVPEFSFIDLDRGFDIENFGIEPTEGFRVVLTPEDEVAGRDPQLDMAIDYLIGEKDKPEYRLPEVPDFPDRSTPWFRKRSEQWMNRP